MSTTEETKTTDPVSPSPSVQDRQRQMRQLLLFGVIGFIVLVFLLLLAFGGGPSKPTATLRNLPDLRGKGLQYAQDEADVSGWGDAVAYDSTGQDRSVGDRRNWRVCFQAPAPGKQLDDSLGTPRVAIDGHHDRAAGQLWLGVVRTDESCDKLGNDYGIVPRVYNLNGRTDADKGTNLVPNLFMFTPHMARLAFGEDASIRVKRIPVKDASGKVKKQGLIPELREKLTGEKAIQTDTTPEVSTGWDGWQICSQPEPTVPNTTWSGTVVELEVVRYGDSCTDPRLT